jgi:hypothetical protein
MDSLLTAGLDHTPKTKRRSSSSPRPKQPRSPTRRALRSYTSSRDLTVGARIWMWRPLLLREQQPSSSVTAWLLRTTSGSPPPRLTDGSIRDEQQSRRPSPDCFYRRCRHARSPAPRNHEQDRDLLPLREGQITPRHRREGERRHPATLAEPPDTNARQDTRLRRSVDARCPSSDRRPEPDPVPPTPSRRTSPGTRPCCSSTI